MANASSLRGFTVLVVEDDAATLNAFSHVIANVFGCRVLSASSSEAALQIIKSGADIDLMFSDVVMPGMDGVMLATVVREHRPELPIVLTTGFVGGIDTAIATGVIPLLKPFTRQQLESVFNEQLRVVPPRGRTYPDA